LSSAVGSERDFYVFIPDQPLGSDRRHGILLDHISSRILQIHHHSHFVVRPARQLDVSDRAFVNASYPHIGAVRQSSHRLKVRIETIGRTKHELFAADQEHARGENEQRRDDKSPKSKSSRHSSPP
jgi:hypothetical protein